MKSPKRHEQMTADRGPAGPDVATVPTQVPPLVKVSSLTAMARSVEANIRYAMRRHK